MNNKQSRTNESISKNKFNPAIRMNYLFIFVVIIITLCFLSLGYSFDKYKRIASNEASILAESLESMLHSEHIVELEGAANDINKPEYKMLKNNLQHLAETTNPIQFAYIMRLVDNNIVILLDSEPVSSPDYSPPGQIYDEANPIFKRPFQTGQTILTPPISDRWGTWISALVPVIDSDSGQVIAIFGVDYSARDWQIKLYQQMIPDFIIVFSLLLFLVALLYTYYQKTILRALSDKLTYDEALYHSIFTQAPIGIALAKGNNFLLESEYGHANINPMFEKILDRPKSEISEVSWPDMTYSDDLKVDLEMFDQFKKGKTDAYTLEKRFVKPDNTIVWTNMTISKLMGLADEREMHLCLIEDITARKLAEHNLFESERSKSVLLSNLPGMAYRCCYDINWTMQFVSDGCFKLTGYKAEDLINNKNLSYNDIITPVYRQLLWNEWANVLRLRKPFRYEYEITTATGEQKWVMELGEGIFNDSDEVEALEGIILDISDRKTAEDRLLFTSEHDSWTGLFNRRYLEKILNDDAYSINPEKRALVCINLNTMYLLSLSYGFGYSQNVLKSIADTLSVLCNSKRMLFSSYEYRFVFYLKAYHTKDDLLDFCKELSDRISPIMIAERITGGIGILEINDDNKNDIELMLKNVLLATESSLKNDESDISIIFYDDEMSSQINREENISRELLQICDGINVDRLYLQFQPIVDLSKNKICGFEALARLNSEYYGNVPPNEFIQVAEKNKLIIKLGDIIINKALFFLRDLENNGFSNITVSINISAIQLLRNDFSDNLLEMIKRFAINPANIWLELTESIFSSNFDEINKIISRLKNQGMKIAIDDFGTGYSSLAREREINANCLKIDKYFIDKLLIYQPGETITSDIISMGHKLGHRIIAEGVEYASQLEYLIKHGCDMVQGYLISKPLNEEIAIEKLRVYNNGSDC